MSQAPHHSEQKCQIHLKRQGMLDQVKTGDAIRCSFLKSLSCKTPLEQSVHGSPDSETSQSYESVHVRTRPYTSSFACRHFALCYLLATSGKLGKAEEDREVAY